MDRSVLARAIKEKSYLEGDFTLSSGAKSSYYIDKYLFETEPAILEALAIEMAEMLPPDIERIAAPELGAVAIAAALSIQCGKPFIIVRKEEKGYGTAKRLEGSFRIGEKVALIEDIVTSGGQVLKAARALRELGLEVDCIMAVIDREEGGGETIRAGGFNYRALFRKSDLGIA